MLNLALRVACVALFFSCAGLGHRKNDEVRVPSLAAQTTRAGWVGFPLILEGYDQSHDISVPLKEKSSKLRPKVGDG
jgi:hypothetical protein